MRAWAILSPAIRPIIPAPYWVSYPDMVRVAEGEPVIIETGIEDGFKVTAEKLEAAITPSTRVLFLNSPSNPTGSCYTRAELESLGEVLIKHPKSSCWQTIFMSTFTGQTSHSAALRRPVPICTTRL